MADGLNFTIPKALEAKKISSNLLIKGFGLPLVKRAFIATGEYLNADEPDGFSRFNTPLYGTVFFKKPAFGVFKYSEESKVYEESPVDLKGNTAYPDDEGVYVEGAIIKITQNRDVVVTQVEGAPGTVKEFINNGDYTVRIQGYFADKNPDVFPLASVRAMQLYLAAPVALEVVNVFLNSAFDVSSLVCIGSKFKQVEGVRNVQYFEAEFLSDIAFQIEQNSGNALQT